MRVIFLLAAFLSSSLLFVVEPLAAKIVLPTFGGAPQVWNASLLFFQAILLLGYLYAHVTTQRLSVNVQRFLHVGVLLVAIAALPISAHGGWFIQVQKWAAAGGPPLGLVLLALLGLVGLPFFALSANSSLLQRWYALSGQPDAAQPWFLYSSGNVGSMLALLAYPSVIEPHLTLSEQGRWWTGGFAILLILLATCAIVSRRSVGPKSEPIPETEAGIPAIDEHASSAPVPLERSQKLRWLALSAVPSSLLLGVTTYVTSNLAPIPLLWVVPLALYLLTFILVFARKPIAPAKVLARIYPLILTPLVLILVLESTLPVLTFVHLAAFFVACWMCHSQLALQKPSAEHLTEYFFYLSLGGVFGGVFNAILAPVMFNTLAEYPIALIAAALLMPQVGKDRTNRFKVAYPIGVAIITLASILITQQIHMEAGTTRTIINLGLPAILCFLAVDSPIPYGLSIAAVLAITGALHIASNGTVALTARSFFGVHRILLLEHGRFHELVNGTTIHGIQDTQHPSTPLTYYYPNGPIGIYMKAVQPRTAAFVGLGVGSLAAYGQPGDRYTYYEIDPIVRDVASDPKWFTFLSDSKAKMNVVLGDARLELARSPDSYDLIVLDAFSSDTIPIHLLTRDAVQMYLTHLKKDGVLAFHVSNRYLYLEPILADIAADLHLHAYSMVDGATADEAAAGKKESDWVILAPTLTTMYNPKVKLNWWSEMEHDHNRTWTDDYSDVLGAFHTSDD